jgi:hypothetical protein
MVPGLQLCFMLTSLIQVAKVGIFSVTQVFLGIFFSSQLVVNNFLIKDDGRGLEKA